MDKVQCRKTTLGDWAAYLTFYISGQVIQGIYNAEKKKSENPDSERTPTKEDQLKEQLKLLLLGVGKIGCDVIEQDINNDLCNPIDIS